MADKLLKPLAITSAENLLALLQDLRGTETPQEAEHAAAEAAVQLAGTAVVALASIADSLAALTAVFAPPADGAA